MRSCRDAPGRLRRSSEPYVSAVVAQFASGTLCGRYPTPILARQAGLRAAAGALRPLPTGKLSHYRKLSHYLGVGKISQPLDHLGQPLGDEPVAGGAEVVVEGVPMLRSEFGCEVENTHVVQVVGEAPLSESGA